MAELPGCNDGPNDSLRKILIGVNELIGSGGVSETVNITAIGGTATSVNCGTADDGTIRVAQATDCPVTVTGTVATDLGRPEDSASVSGDTGVLSLYVRNDTNATLTTTDLDYGAPTVDLAGNTRVVGNLAHDAVDAGNPVKIGTVGRTTLPTAVADGDRVNTMGNKYGEIATIHAIREMRANQVTTITASTAETTIVTAVASFMLDLYGLIVTNTSATAVNVAIKDATAGTTRLNIAVPAGETRGYMLPASDGIKQATANNNWTATVSASVTSVIITALTKQTT